MNACPPRPRVPCDVPQAATDTRTLPSEETDTEQPSAWNVVLLNDDDHTYDYVIRMVRELFGHPQEKAVQIAKAVDKQGRAICLTTHKEHAELKRDQVHAYGADPLMEESRGSMSAIIEPASFGDDSEEPGEP